MLTLKSRFALLAASGFLLGSALAQEDLPEPGSPEWRQHFAVDVAADRLAEVPVALPGKATTYSVTYKGEIAGFDVGRVFLTVAASDTRYSIKYRMEQKGIARWFSDANATTVARGTIENGDIGAHYYLNHDFEAEDDQQYVEMYRPANARRIHLWADPVYTFHQPVPEDVAFGAVDPMAALMSLGFLPRQTAGSPCDRVVKTFDGRRRFDLVMTDDGTEDIRKGGKGRFEGTAHRCRLDQVKVAGYRAKDSGDIDGDLWVYIVPVPETFRTSTMAYVPVMIRAKQGVFTARLEGKYPTITGPNGKSVQLGRD
ncbi:DUF3108 domain-containing protein [Parvularcula sp. LCG005]|uniref:DUF3108 domain-containing protein n=1 Tax=Parvularcula sp. LCG005 TaxID=3078805 RepID=UPI0029439E61|nr:DUF3108 domain-containing protein [Parvularcula sp. LCG005]WOI54528.1 DUF3108 domain-containing protein [Parvularcula sp. LCG005]